MYCYEKKKIFEMKNNKFSSKISFLTKFLSSYMWRDFFLFYIVVTSLDAKPNIIF